MSGKKCPAHLMPAGPRTTARSWTRYRHAGAADVVAAPEFRLSLPSPGTGRATKRSTVHSLLFAIKDGRHLVLHRLEIDRLDRLGELWR